MRRQQRYVRDRSREIPHKVVWGLLAAFLLAALITIYLTFSFFRGVGATRASETPAVDITPPPDAAPFVMDPESMTVPLQEANRPAAKNWDGESRINVLVVGLDARDWEDDGGPSRTDTMILLTFDPATMTAGILSIPRDLWVQIPGFDYAKINTAYFLGEGYQVDGGGPGLAMATVENFLGVEVDYYAQVDFNAFEGFIDEIGGIDVQVPEEITVDPVGPGNTVILEAGVQHLDGKTALAYARNRDTAGGDIDRADRQQQVIMAIRNQVLNLNMLPLLIQKSPILYTQLANGVHTNLTLEQIISLAWKAAQVPAQNIKRAHIGLDQASLDFSWDGQSILLPNYEAIYALRDDIFTPGTTTINEPAVLAPAATATGDPSQLFQAEGARVAVLNGTETSGLAAKTREYLLSQDINVVDTGNADEIYQLTSVIDYTGKIYTRQYIADIMSIQPSQVYSSYDPNSEVDLVVILGNDWAVSNPMP